MDQVYAKIKSRSSSVKYRKLLSTEENIYAPMEQLVESYYPYSAGVTLNVGEWFKINEFSKKKYSIEITRVDYESVDFDSLQKHEYEHVDYLFTQAGKNLFFQNIGKSKLIKKKGIIYIGERYSYHKNISVLFINEIPDAIYSTSEDALYFQKIESISSIFNGISELYREATEHEVKDFLQNNFIELSNDFDSSKVKTANRRRIAMAMDTLSKMQDLDKEKIFKYICDYCPGIVTSDNKFNVGTEENLKMVLYGIEQRFYTTPIGGEKRLANSVVAL